MVYWPTNLFFLMGQMWVDIPAPCMVRICRIWVLLCIYFQDVSFIIFESYKLYYYVSILLCIYIIMYLCIIQSIWIYIMKHRHTMIFRLGYTPLPWLFAEREVPSSSRSGNLRPNWLCCRNALQSSTLLMDHI